mmetsp:Transcript_11143/g.32217  ORF Transcript_11143/g.32217 Transcript_11143/m.32217 type:complete len:220 (-) Transcript_11143:337-996(-)
MPPVRPWATRSGPTSPAAAVPRYWKESGLRGLGSLSRGLKASALADQRSSHSPSRSLARVAPLLPEGSSGTRVSMAARTSASLLLLLRIDWSRLLRLVSSSGCWLASSVSVSVEAATATAATDCWSVVSSANALGTGNPEIQPSLSPASAAPVRRPAATFARHDLRDSVAAVRMCSTAATSRGFVPVLVVCGEDKHSTPVVANAVTINKVIPTRIILCS